MAYSNDENMRLTGKQKLFCENYVSNGYKLVQAYMDAFGCSYETANANQWKIMKKPSIKNYIRELQHERYEAMGVTADKIAAKLAEMAFADKDDEKYTPAIAQKALDLLQKQLGLQTQKVEAEVKTTVIDVSLDDGE